MDLHHIMFFFVPSMEQRNKEAMDLLYREIRQLGHDLEIEEVKCDETMMLMFTCPFIADKEDEEQNYYGIPGIQSFVKRLRSEHLHNGRRKSRISASTVT